MNYGFAPVQLLLKEIRKAFGLTQNTQLNSSVKSGFITKYELDSILEDTRADLSEHLSHFYNDISDYMEFLIYDYLQVASLVQTACIPRPYLVHLLNLRYLDTLINLS